MARKAVNGYPEKSYYDNTMFKGIVATSDTLNEGSFALLTNLDITDSGKSVLPRKGYTSTTFSVNNEPVILSDKILMYRDPNIQKDIIIDLKKLDDTNDTLSKFAYTLDITQYNIDNNIIGNYDEGHLVDNYDCVDLAPIMLKNLLANKETEVSGGQLKANIEQEDNKLWIIMRHSTILGDSQLTPIKDKDGVTYYIKKLAFSYGVFKFNWWLKVLYRVNTTTVGGVEYTGDTLVLSAIDTAQQTVNFLNRNIASPVSIIPNPIRTQEPVGTIPTTPSDVNRPVLLKYNNKYATTKLPMSAKTYLDVDVIPTFHLQDPKVILGGLAEDDTAKWAYRFDFIRTDSSTEGFAYKTPWRHLKNTVSGPNDVISAIYVGDTSASDKTYTYYLISDAIDNTIDLDAATSQLSNEEVAARVYDLLAANTYPIPYTGTLQDVYLMHNEEIVAPYKKPGASLDTLYSGAYDDLFRMRVSFITEDNMRTAVATVGQDLDTLTAAKDSLTQAEVDALATGGNPYTASTRELSTPNMAMTHAGFLGASAMPVSSFILHAKEKQKTHKIKIVFVPFKYHYQGTDSVTQEPINMVYFFSIGSIYINGLRKNLTRPVTAIADYDKVLSTPKTFVLSIPNTEGYINVFEDLGNLKVSNTLEYIPRSFYDKGIYLVLYLKPYNKSMLDEYADKSTQEILLVNKTWDESSYKQSSAVTWAQASDVVYLDEVDEENSEYIRGSVNTLVFEDRLVVWSGNKVFVSEEGDYHYFTKILKKEFPEEVLKVLAFKTILLVFTTQNLYAIYRAEVDTATGGYTSEGTPEIVKAIVWLQQPVLYNINPDRKYLDVIQVYNQMILFYSTEGQLYMIKPSTTIDSETQFGIQYFNKSANNILANYHDYINERLKIYNKLNVDDPEDYVTKDKVKIKALVDIDLIKIFYTVPGRITFILIYDVVNNRYTTYDTLSFTDIDSAKHVEGGEMYVTRYNTNTYITLPVIGATNVDQNTDMHYARMFKKEPVFGFIDTGNLNLNNHLRKRLRDLQVVIKNLDATKILYNAELLLDDCTVRPMYGSDFKVRMTNGPDSTMVVSKVPLEDINELFGLNQTIGVSGDRTSIHSYYLHKDTEFFNNNALLKTETLNSNKLIEYNSSILGLGKVIRLRLQFISKGKYKLQSFGIVYKERRI